MTVHLCEDYGLGYPGQPWAVPGSLEHSPHRRLDATSATGRTRDLALRPVRSGDKDSDACATPSGRRVWSNCGLPGRHEQVRGGTSSTRGVALCRSVHGRCERRNERRSIESGSSSCQNVQRFSGGSAAVGKQGSQCCSKMQTEALGKRLGIREFVFEVWAVGPPTPLCSWSGSRFDGRRAVPRGQV
jgi:hypothetical protein